MQWIVAVIYLGTRLLSLTNLPVFADEAIYIRWAQMIKNDPGQYFFLPLYDGKTPLMMWLLNIFLPLSPLDPLWAARLLSVLFGAATLYVLIQITKMLEGSRTSLWLTGLLYITLPFTFFHDRLALTDTMMVFFLSLTTLLLIKLQRNPSRLLTLVTGIVFGLALLAKLSALFFIPQFFLILWLLPRDETAVQKTRFMFAGVLLIGPLILLSLRLSPLFPFLFQRGGDFTVPVYAIFSGQVDHIWHNISQFIRWLSWYVPGLLTTFLIVVLRKNRMAGVLLLMALLWALPFILVGKIVYSRYYLPMIIFLIPATALAWEKLKIKPLLVISSVLYFVWFSVPLYTNLANTHLQAADKEQYLTTWSAGFGIPEVRDLIKQKTSQGIPIAVATEGYFGTLPDGLLMYFDRYPLIDKLRVFGVGQPIIKKPAELESLKPVFETYLMVNSSRLHFDYSACCTLEAVYKRPQSTDDVMLLKVL